MAITIENCNSIDRADITLQTGSLNIKYGHNGLGKSTIARALILAAQDPDSLGELTPFKHRGDPEAARPSIKGSDDIGSVLVFDDDYVSRFVFQADEVLQDSFEVFVKTPEYEQGLTKLETLFERVKMVFTDEVELNAAVLGFAELQAAFPVTKSGRISKSGKGYKALGAGGKLNHIPEGLTAFSEFLRSDDPAGWLTWQSKGKAYLDLSTNCPFCSTSSVDKDTALLVSDEYESAAVKNMAQLNAVLEKLSDFINPVDYAKIWSITTTLADPSEVEEDFLSSLRSQVELILEKFSSLQTLSFTSLRDSPDVTATLEGLRIDLDLLDALSSERTRGVVETLNGELDHLADQMGEIERQMGLQKSRVAKTIKENRTDINAFLLSAGYQYAVSVEPNGDSYRMIVEHRDSTGHLSNARTHLSYGERNAFALVLFMHQVRRDEPDLVVLDDPVSSFDKSKKFAILHKLFHGANSLRGFTTLLLTHDLEPAIDIVRTATSKQFQAALPSVKFLKLRAGIVSEETIARDDIMTFSDVCRMNLESFEVATILKCIYLRRRLEVHGTSGPSYDVLSSLFKARPVPHARDGAGGFVPLDDDATAEAVAAIRCEIPDFDYQALVSEVQDFEALKATFTATSVGYEQVQIFRLITPLLDHSANLDAGLKKFINESYHIENEYVMQLNPRHFDAVPDYILQACAAHIG
jgi:energy-coupling factor transporter ATP-binding protein EcfA2